MRTLGAWLLGAVVLGCGGGTPPETSPCGSCAAAQICDAFTARCVPVCPGTAYCYYLSDWVCTLDTSRACGGVCCGSGAVCMDFGRPGDVRCLPSCVASSSCPGGCCARLTDEGTTGALNYGACVARGVAVEACR